MLDGSRAAIIEQVQTLSEEALNAPNQFPSIAEPVWREVCGDVMHINGHLWPIIYERGDLAYAAEISDREAVLAAGLNNSPEWQGLVHYNLACRLALNGHTERALELLEVALRERPNLKDWSQQDSDLVSLHDDPRYKALIARVNQGGLKPAF